MKVLCHLAGGPENCKHIAEGATLEELVDVLMDHAMEAGPNHEEMTMIVGTLNDEDRAEWMETLATVAFDDGDVHGPDDHIEDKR